MIQKLSCLCLEYLLNQNVLSHNSKEQETYRYGIEVIISDCIDIGLLMIVAIMQDKLLECVIYYLSFGYIRKFSGGYHSQNYHSCISLHVVIFYIYTILNIPHSINLIIGTISAVIIALMSPIENINRKLKKEDILKYKIITIIIVLLHCIFMFCFYTLSTIIAYTLFVVSLLMVICIKDK